MKKYYLSWKMKLNKQHQDIIIYITNKQQDN